MKRTALSHEIIIKLDEDKDTYDLYDMRTEHHLCIGIKTPAEAKELKRMYICGYVDGCDDAERK